VFRDERARFALDVVLNPPYRDLLAIDYGVRSARIAVIREADASGVDDNH